MQRKGHVRIQQEGIISKPREEVHPEPNSADTFILDFYPLELRENKTPAVHSRVSRLVQVTLTQCVGLVVPTL